MMKELLLKTPTPPPSLLVLPEIAPPWSTHTPRRRDSWCCP
jgi:hypothetical protein